VRFWYSGANIAVEIKTPLLTQASIEDESVHMSGVASFLSESEEYSFLASLTLARSHTNFTASMLLYGSDLSVLLVGRGGFGGLIFASVTPPSLCTCYQFTKWGDFKKTIKDPEPPDTDRYWFFTPSTGLATWREFDFHEAEYVELAYACDHFDQGAIQTKTLTGLFVKEARDMSAPLTYTTTVGYAGGVISPVPQIYTTVTMGAATTVKMLEVDESDYPWKKNECPS
jgi:hypothetical protein